MATHLTVGLAQIDCRLGCLEVNLDRHLDWIARARDRQVELLLFPELSLTGYRLLHLTSRVAVRLDGSPLLQKMIAACGDDISVVVGLVEKGDEGVLFNSAVLIHRGAIVHVHRKLYLPTYGIFQEGRFFAAGRRLTVAARAELAIGLLICEDLWHPHLARGLAGAGARILGVISAGPGRIGSGDVMESQETWESLTRSTALVNTSWVLYCNRVGWEEGSFYGGSSHVVRPDGRILQRASPLEEELLVASLDLREVERMRWRVPLLQSERHDIEVSE